MSTDLTSLPGLPQPAPHEDPSWYAEAACRTLPPDLFFPAGRTGSAATLAEGAKKVCERCPVAGPCLEFALQTNQEYGVWGGTTEDERRSIRRETRSLGMLTSGPARGAAS